MKHFFYPRIALRNIKNNGKTYFPFILTCVGTVLMFYNLCAITFHNATGTGSLRLMLLLGTTVTGLFSIIFLYYTNSFLTKRRKKEFGLFNILGMEKRHLGIVMLWESIIVSAISIGLGILVGILFNKLITLFLYKLLYVNPDYSFTISPFAILITIALFLCIFVLNLISTLWQVGKAKPVELLQGGNVGEKEPRSNFFVAAVGFIALGAGYFIALTTKTVMAIIGNFFIAALLVILGTYCLFTFGSVVILKLMKKNKKFYYQTKHFVSVSGMIYRMKKNAAGLANICIMSTAVLVMISTTASLYIGMDDLMKYRYPSDAVLTESYSSQNRPDTAQFKENIMNILHKNGANYSNFKSYEYLSFTANNSGSSYTPYENQKFTPGEDLSTVILINAEDYSVLSGIDTKLEANEAIVYSSRLHSSIDIFGEQFTVKQNINEPVPIGQFRAWLVDLVFVVVDNTATIDKMYDLQAAFYPGRESTISYDVVFDFKMNNQQVIEFCSNTFIPQFNELSGDGYNLSYSVRQLQLIDAYELYGGLFFIGIFLGILFLLATVLIIYYKQVAEGFEDKERFRIMQNVGMSRHEVKQAIHSQILTVFALPIIAAFSHIAFAFPILTKLLRLLQLSNTSIFIMCTVTSALIFAVIYVIVYMLTSKVYYKAING